ncbi:MULTISPECIES: transcription-repair coupling factor [Corynebacterium]|uniref:Transcription-repair-coupling factor n=1 Tax=Corynebacterium lipophilum TaxID=2804918 RepID=A0AAW5HRP4_9CORY|nr:MULTISPECIES: transcription-repair coupling factor [Corynebacterium]MCO6394158.1 transcription-repair coupling factor [Corynebacterium lipophilum]MCQ4607198.1 transcription-repair coupling factor [Corynebacterium pseudogenitalium]MCQ4609324.1 transcription-repair coupling factor [Corynebacterium sp. CCUG 61414]MCZ2116509.1 transcription-repair coupling factor [Corynebacterium lipophilum]MDK8244394.1 transcription-repair coupling factor [Corynebacterium sp. UMB10321]
MALTDPKLKGLVGNIGVDSLHVTGIDQVRSWATGALARQVPVLLVTATSHEAEDLTAELQAMLGKGKVANFPAFETLPHERLSPAPDVVGARAKVLWEMPQVIVASARAFCQPVLPAVEPITVKVDTEWDFTELTEQAVNFAYEHVDMVAKRGEFATRGGIIDIFPTTAEYPVRLEFWGDEVTDIRSFAVADQRTIEELTSVELFPARQLIIDASVAKRADELARTNPSNTTLVQLLTRISEHTHADGEEVLIPVLSDAKYSVLPELMPKGSIVFVSGPEKVRTRIADLEATDQEFLEAGWEAAAMGAEGPLAVEGLDVSASSFRSFESLEVSARNAGNAWWTFAPPGMFAADDAMTLPLEFEAAPAPKGEPKAIEQLYATLKLHVQTNGGKVAFVAPAKGTVERMAERLREHGISARIATPGLEPVDGAVTVYQSLSHAGLVFPGPNLVVVTETDVTGNRVGDIAGAKRRRPRRRNRVDPLALTPGDFVVHDTHGIGKFIKMAERTIKTGDEASRREYIVLEYQPAKRGQPGDQLWVPMESLDLLSKYTGGEKPSLSKMGGSDWKNTKRKARAAVREIAGELIELYAKRQAAPGHAFGPDTPWQHEMEDAFPFVETEDQLAAIEAVKEDMEKPTPMDRVIVGDVGFGKTEVAVRAAFKAVQDGQQVAVLVPTTLLAQQHYSTFNERMDGFGVTVRELSRFTSAKEAKEIMAGLADGSVDVVIGTHRLLQTGVFWKQLGLIIVDEEQRFGVEHKEHIKALKSHVDVLTMTATPIPRTLEMSLTGIREMTSITTPPEDRHPVLTYVGPQEEKQVAAAIRRELLRDGQVFYIHNRVSDIEKTARSLRQLVPEARVVVAHGQMGEQQLEQTVQGFWNREFDVLVCTTIVETGLDIANANTLIVENAQNMGLSQLHQLRGRVGRSRERGYAYFLYPKEKTLTETSYDRLATIAQNNDLGAGIAVAQKDLEMRGAGNVLGAEQSGHIAGVGFDMYVRLVGEAVETYKALMTGEVVDATDQGPKEIRVDLPVDAHIPESYINAERLRLDVYRKLAEARDEQDLRKVAEEMIDRFGPLPTEVLRLFAVARVRHLARTAGISDILTQGTRIKFHPVELPDSKQVRLKRLYSGANYRAAAKTLQVPMPREGKGINQPNLRDMELLQWVADFIADIFDAEKISVTGESDGDGGRKKKRIISVSQ